MKISFDYEIMIDQKMGGISRYVKEIFCGLDKYSDVNKSLKSIFPRNEFLSKEIGVKGCLNYPDGAVKYVLFLNNLLLKKALIKNNDIIHQTLYKIRIPEEIRSKVVVTVYDMIVELMPEHEPTGVMAKNKYLAMKRADKIIAISETTKRDILKFYPDIPDEKISVIYLGMNDFSKIEPVKPEGVPEKFVLYVGDRKGYKNFDTFIYAMKEVLSEDSDLSIVLAGNRPISVEEANMFEKLQIANRVYYKRCTDKELSYLYNHAVCFVFPSRYEGFGLPLLEAFSAKCPTILADTPVFRELAEDAVLFFNPDNHSELAQNIIELVNNDNLRSRLINRGIERCKNFTWKNAVDKHHDLYLEMLNG